MKADFTLEPFLVRTGVLQGTPVPGLSVPLRGMPEAVDG